MNQKKSKWNPAVWLKNTSIRFRLYMVLVVFAIPLLALAFQVSRARLDEVTQLNNEETGVGHIVPLLGILKEVTNRNAAVTVCQVGGDACPQIPKITASIDEYFGKADEQEARHGAAHKTAEMYAGMKKKWGILKARGVTGSVQQNNADHREIAVAARDMMRVIYRTSDLTLDTDAATFAVIDGMVNYLVVLYVDAEDLRTSLYPVVAGKVGTAADLTHTTDYIRFIERQARSYRECIDVANQADSSGLDKLVDLVPKAKADREKFQNDVLFPTISAGRITMDVDDFYRASVNFTGGYDLILEEAAAYLTKRIQMRVAAANRQVILALAMVIGSVVICAILLFLIVRSITLPLHQTVAKVRVVADGDLTQRLDIDSKDEVGSLAAGMNTLVNNLDSIIFKIFDASSQLASSSGNLAEASNSLSASTEESSRQSQTIAASATQMNQNLQVVASAIEEMSVSIGEVARKTGEAASIANKANTTSRETNTIVKALGESAKEIGKVIETISGIASQTNLLALNAAIEAAGAGEAGKGFAVVAAEVKELARQSAQASEEIKQKISAIQQSTEQAVVAIDGITNVVGEVSEISTTIASSVEEQSIAAREIAQNVSQSSQASSDVTMNINGISTASKAGAQDAGRAATLAADLQKISASLSEIVTQFKFTQNGKNGTHGANGSNGAAVHAVAASLN